MLLLTEAAAEVVKTISVYPPQGTRRLGACGFCFPPRHPRDPERCKSRPRPGLTERSVVDAAGAPRSTSSPGAAATSRQGARRRFDARARPLLAGPAGPAQVEYRRLFGASHPRVRFAGALRYVVSWQVRHRPTKCQGLSRSRPWLRGVSLDGFDWAGVSASVNRKSRTGVGGGYSGGRRGRTSRCKQGAERLRSSASPGRPAPGPRPSPQPLAAPSCRTGRASWRHPRRDGRPGSGRARSGRPRPGCPIR